MQQKASRSAAPTRRAMKDEDMSLELDADGQPIFCSLKRETFGETVRLVDGDSLVINHIPECIDRSLGLDGLEKVYVRGDCFEFPHHNNTCYHMGNFAGCGVEVTLVDHAGAGWTIDGAQLVYKDPAADSIYDGIVAIGAGC